LCRLTPFADAALVAGHEVLVASPELFGANVEAAGSRVSAFGDIPPEEFAAVLREARAGVPLMVVPQVEDQPAIGEAVDQSGTAISLGDVDPPDVEKALTRVLSAPAFAERAREPARDIAGLPPASAAVELFESPVELFESPV
jgi:hypothetical protein